MVASPPMSRVACPLPLHGVGGFRGFCLVFCRDPLLVLLSKSAGLAAEFSFYN